MPYTAWHHPLYGACNNGIMYMYMNFGTIRYQLLSTFVIYTDVIPSSSQSNLYN